MDHPKDAEVNQSREQSLLRLKASWEFIIVNANLEEDRPDEVSQYGEGEDKSDREEDSVEDECDGCDDEGEGEVESAFQKARLIRARESLGAAPSSSLEVTDARVGSSTLFPT
ncbi:hypothetical protein HDV00_010174 [Rhizophlyctis rosea]|nr:hypothetical protein HDV00_010174 [Rhizophlyctis rosea]